MGENINKDDLQNQDETKNDTIENDKIVNDTVELKNDADDEVIAPKPSQLPEPLLSKTIDETNNNVTSIDNFAKLREQIKLQQEQIQKLQDKNTSTERQLFAEKNNIPEQLLNGNDLSQWQEVAKIYNENIEKAKSDALGSNYKPMGKIDNNQSTAISNAWQNVVQKRV